MTTNNKTKSEVVKVEEAAIVRLVQDFSPAILKSILGLVEYHTGLIDQTKTELQQVGQDLETANQCLSAAEELDIPDLVRRHKRVIAAIGNEKDFLSRRLVALEEGFLPIPRFDFASIEWSGEMMNYKTLERIGEMKAQRFATYKMEPLVLKRTTAHLAGKELTDDEAGYNVKAGGMHQTFYINQVIAMLEADTVNWENQKVPNALKRLYDLLDKAMMVRA